MSLIENEEMVEALSSNRADDPLCEGILPGRARGGEDLANPHPLDSPRELLAVDPRLDHGAGTSEPYLPGMPR